MSNLSWTFRQFENFIIGKSEKNLGTLQISLAFRSEPKEKAKDSLLEFAELSSEDEPDFHLEKASGTDYGYFDSRRNGITSRYWFTVKTEGLTLAVYSTKTNFLDNDEMKDCESILLETTF